MSGKMMRAHRAARIYPCADCGIMRSKDEGGTVFTVCDACWKIHYDKKLGRIVESAGRRAIAKEVERG